MPPSIPRSVRSSQLLLATSLTLLAACSQSPAPVETNPYANGADYPWTYTRSDTQLGSQALTPGDNTLFYEPILSATNGWGPLEIDRSNGEQGANDGRAITLNGVVYKKGLGVHAGSDIRYSLKGSGANCVRFTADIGVDDEVGSRGSVVFQVFADSVKLYDSGVMSGVTATKQFSVDVSGRQELRLVVTDAGNGKDFDHADWANPRITCVAAPSTPTGSPDPGFGSAGRAPVGGVDSVVEPGNTLVVLGGDFSLRRLSATGAVAASAPAPAATGSGALALARQPDGRLVAVGAGKVVRFRSDLGLDATFGTGGIVTLPDRFPNDVLVQPDGKIVVAGSANRPRVGCGELCTGLQIDMYAGRFNLNGSPDASFGTNGAFYADSLYEESRGGCCSNEPDIFSAVALAPDGKIVVVGISEFQGQANGTIVRLSSAGQLDTAFGQDGVTFGYSRTAVNALLVQPDGKLVIVGVRDTRYPTGFISRYGASGNFESSTEFEFDGPIEQLEPFSYPYEAALQADGALVVAGLIEDRGGIRKGAVARFSSALVRDTTFGNVVLDNSAATSVQFDSTGKILVTTGTSTTRLFP